MAEFFTWAILITFAGATAATSLVTQFIKGLGVLAKVPTQLVSYVVALIILLAATAATGAAHGWADWAIVPLNAIIVAMAANGAYSAVERFRDGRSL